MNCHSVGPFKMITKTIRIIIKPSGFKSQLINLSVKLQRTFFLPEYRLITASGI